MMLFDVNVLVFAYREDAEAHERYRSWLEGVVDSDAPFGLSDLVLSGFLRIVTHRKIYNPPSPVEDALRFAHALRDQPNCVPIAPGPRHWEIFERLCKHLGASGSLVPDAYLAALAIESGSEWITADDDFSRFPGLRWRHPLR